MTDTAPREVVQVIYPGVTLLDMSGPAQVFRVSGRVTPDGEFQTGPKRYQITIASKDGGPVPTDTEIEIHTVPLSSIDACKVDTLLVSGGMGVHEARKDAELVDWIRTNAPLARRYGSTCLGAFLMAETGLTRGQRVASHWRWASDLQAQFPDVQVESDQIFIEGDPVWSSAGVTSGIDMALAMVQADHGHKLSIETARQILVYYRRPGNQAQYSNRLKMQLADEGGRFDALHDWMLDNLRAAIDTELMAHRQGMSARNFSRVYKEVTGMTPAKSLENMRVEEAKKLLARDGISVSAAARAVGFGSEATMRRAFMRVIDMAPRDYQDRNIDRRIAAE